MRSKPRVAVGIDLGTSKCCVGVVRDGKVEILENERGNKTTPSYVAFTDTERLVGEDAKDQATLNPANTVSGVKRLLGRKFEDPAVQELVSRLPYKLQCTELGKPFFELEYMEQRKKLFPEQVTAMLLTKIVDLVRKQLDWSVEEAVISVPASFSNAQRQATKDAATIAGLKVLALINEPTAAAIAYQASRKEEGAEIIAVVDFGGGKIELSFVLVEKGVVEVMAVYGCNRIGGLDVDNCLVELLINKFEHERKIDLKHNVKAKERLRNACEKLKHTLSLLPEARVQLDCLSGDVDFVATVTRNEFDRILEKDIITIMNELERRIEWLTVARVLLVGGSTRIPVVYEWLKNTFGSIKLDKTVNPDEAVAQGAAIWAAMLSKHCELPEVDVRDIIPNFLYVNVDKTSKILFKRFTPISKEIVLPLSALSSKSVFTLLEIQSSLNGVRELLLGDFLLRDKSSYSIEIDCEIDKSGILVASLYLNGKKQSLDDVILDTLRLFNYEQLSELIIQEKQFRKDAIAENKRVMALSELEAYCFQQKNSLEALDEQGKSSPSWLRHLKEQIEAAITWVDNNPGAPESVLDQKMIDLQGVCSSLSSNRKERSSRSSSVGHHLKPASPSNGVSQERESRRDQSRAGHDAHKARAVSQSAWRSRQGLSKGMPVVDDSRSANGREASSPDQERDPHTTGESPQRIRGQSPQRTPRDSIHIQASERTQQPSRHKQTSEIPHTSEGSHPKGLSPQRRSGGCTTMQPQSPNSPQFRGTASHQSNNQFGLAPLSSNIIKEFAENLSKQKESNFPPSIKKTLLLTDRKFASSLKVLSSSNQSGPDNKRPVQGVDARASSRTPASGSRSQSGDQDWADSQSSSLPYQDILASVSQSYTQQSTGLVTSPSGGMSGHATTTSNYKDPSANYISVFQPPNISVNDVNRSEPLRSTYLSSTNSSSTTSRLITTEASTPTSLLESNTSSDHWKSSEKRRETRSIGVQTNFPNQEKSTRRPTTSTTCDVCCLVFRCGCTPANGLRENLGSSVMKESNDERKGYLPDSVHERSGSESRGAFTIVPPPQYSTSPPNREGGSGRPTTSSALRSALTFMPPPQYSTSPPNREGGSGRPTTSSALRSALTFMPPPQYSTSPPNREGGSGRMTTSLIQTSAPSHYTAPVTMTSHFALSPYYATPKTPLITSSTQPTNYSTSFVAATRSVTSPSHSSHNPSRNPSGRIDVPVSSMCSHGDRLESCISCLAKHSEQFREKVDARRTVSKDRSNSGAGAACKCGQVSCRNCYYSGSTVRSGPTAEGRKVLELMKKFETDL